VQHQRIKRIDVAALRFLNERQFVHRCAFCTRRQSASRIFGVYLTACPSLRRDGREPLLILPLYFSGRGVRR
jgi:hypothetical protein